MLEKGVGEGGKSCKSLNAWGKEGPKIEVEQKESEGKGERRGSGDTRKRPPLPGEVRKQT